jgi:hypothetical protein
MAEQSKELDNIERAIRIIEIALTVGRHILHIMWLFIGISVALAVYDFATDNIIWGIISSLFALGGIIFMVQIYQHRSSHRYRTQTRLAEKRPEYKVASA